MATTHSAELPAEHPAQAATRRTMRHCLAAAVVFTVFAYITAHVHQVRAGSPWQDDPYDAVVSFTLFLVPALAVLTGVRAVLLRRHGPQPVYRVAQLLRASVLFTAMIATTVLTDWTAVALRADHALWNGGTPWLIAALALPTVAAAGAGLSIARTLRRLPAHVLRRGARDGDWLDDLAPTLRALTNRLPGSVAPAVARLIDRPAFRTATQSAREHIVALAATAALVAGTLLHLAQAIGEDWTDPLLVVTAAAIGSGGFFAFAMLCNTALCIAVPRGSIRNGTRGGVRSGHVGRAVRHALTAAALALPCSGGFRGPLGPLVGVIDSVPAFAALTFGSGAVVGVVTFGVSYVRSATRRQPGPTPPASRVEPG